jgi:DNA-nicking Smr family endonuclease
MAKDVDLFKAAMADVTPLEGRKLSKAVVARLKAEETRKPPGRSDTRPHPTTAPASAPFSFDRDVDRALGRGKRSPEAALDLHGMTLAGAERAVSRFLEQAARQDLRVVLVITGKGWRQEDGRFVEGRIRREFPGWLSRADIRARVRGMKPAHPRHGGSGAFYVLLRRKGRDSA